MSNITFKAAFPIIISGIFILAVFAALNYSKLDGTTFLIFLLIAAYVFLFGFAVGQEFSSPIKKILERANEIINGDLTKRVYLKNKDEFGELAKTFNKIADALEKSNSLVQDTENSVDMKVKARTEALEETIQALEQKVQNRAFELEKMLLRADILKDEATKKEHEISDLKNEIERLQKKPKKSIKKNARAPRS